MVNEFRRKKSIKSL